MEIQGYETPQAGAALAPTNGRLEMRYRRFVLITIGVPRKSNRSRSRFAR